jgi:hypothetical protein
LHECLDGDRHVVCVSAFRHSGGNDLIDQCSAMDTVGPQDLTPELEIPSLDEVSSLVLVHLVLVGDVDEFVVTQTLGVGDIGQVGISLFTVLADHEGFIYLYMTDFSDEESSTAKSGLTLFSFKNASGLLLESIAIFATAL